MTIKGQAWLKVPYLSQRDNENNPSGSCNVTSVAMCLKFFGIVGNGEGQLEDQLYKECESKHLSRHELSDLAQLITCRNIKARVDKSATWEAIKAHLDSGKPAIVAGYFTQFGHIIVLRGYNDSKRVFYVNDPYGEWCADGYACSSGENLQYSYSLMERCCSPDDQLWCLFVG